MLSQNPSPLTLLSFLCSITSLSKVSKWGSQYHLNRNLGPYFHLGQGMLSQNPSPLTLLSFLCSITSLTKVSKWGSQYHLNRNLGPYFHLGQGMLSQNPSPLTLLSFLLSPFLSRSPSPSGQSEEIVAVAGNDPRAGKEEASCWKDSRY